MFIQNTLYADVSKEQTFRALLANQYDDNSRKYRLVITNNGVPQPLTQPKTIVLIMKAEGEADPYYNYPLTEAWEGGYPILTFNSQMLSKRGRVYFKFVIYEPSGIEILSTRIQSLIIQETFTNRDGIISNDNYDFLTYLVNEAISVKDNTLLKTDLVNNVEQTVPGVAALDAVMGKTIYDGLLFKGSATNLNDVLNALHENAAVMHSYSGSVTGSPEAIEGTAYTYYLNNTNVLQYIKNFSGNYFWRKRSGTSITDWVKINSLDGISGIDTKGLLGTINAVVGGQSLVDEIANRIVNSQSLISELSNVLATQVVLKTAISNQQINDSNKVAGAALTYQINQTITDINNNLNPSSANSTITLNPTSIVTGNTITMNTTLINTYRGFEIIVAFEGGAYPARQYVPSGIIKTGGTYGLSLIQGSGYFGYVQFTISMSGIIIDNIVQSGWTSAPKISIYGIDKII